MIDADLIPDPIEAGEDRAERFAHDNIQGYEFKCPDCGKWRSLYDAVTVSPDPYAPPMCIDCVESLYDRH